MPSAVPGCRSFSQAFLGSHVLCIRGQASPGKLHGRGSRGASHGGCGHQTPALFQGRQHRGDEGRLKGLQVGLEMQELPPEPQQRFGGDPPSSGDPQGLPGTPSWGQQLLCHRCGLWCWICSPAPPGGMLQVSPWLWRCPLTATLARGTKTSSAAPEKGEKPQIHFPSGFLSAQPMGMGWAGGKAGVSPLLAVL